MGRPKEKEKIMKKNRVCCLCVRTQKNQQENYSCYEKIRY